MDECKHILENGHTAIVVPFNIFFGVNPPLHRGICTLCKKYIELTEEEFKDFKKKYDENHKGGGIG